MANFEESGEVINCVEILPNGPNYGAEIQPRTWNAVLALEPGTVLYEVLEGPYLETTHKKLLPLLLLPWRKTPLLDWPGCARSWPLSSNNRLL